MVLDKATGDGFTSSLRWQRRWEAVTVVRCSGSIDESGITVRNVDYHDGLKKRNHYQRHHQHSFLGEDHIQ
ncbi:hypothetical protein TanjilG_25893 [Lupinus angustifolius]|uniref:Uncharacterized protein n=1 Tax=Lupinus angustifolius TaxID=3871 RepID=A0A1J7G2I3_LUPAN|nr:hypothetical protein TanjilG_25893 [Lupinus angustifolius]